MDLVNAFPPTTPASLETANTPEARSDLRSRAPSTARENGMLGVTVLGRNKRLEAGRCPSCVGSSRSIVDLGVDVLPFGSLAPKGVFAERFVRLQRSQNIFQT